MDVKEIVSESADRIYLAQDRGFYLLSMVDSTTLTVSLTV